MQNQLTDPLIVSVVSTVIIIFILFIMLFVFYESKKKQLLHENTVNEIKYKYEKDILSAQLEIQEETFNKISKDIHDNISLSLTLSKLYLTSFYEKKEYSNSARNNEIINSSISLISKSLADLNDLSKSLDGEMIRKCGLLHTLENEIKYINKIGSMTLDHHIIGKIIYLSWEKELMIFRIIQESIRNSVKHSKCTQIIIKLNYTDSDLTVSISDNGIGFDITENEISNNKISSGISNMKKRSSMLNGKLFVQSKNPNGTSIILELPYN